MTRPPAVPILDINGLRVDIPISGHLRTIIHDVTLTIDRGEAIGLVGESGSGKSMTARAVMGLLMAGAKVRGVIEYEGRSLLGLGRSELRQFRRRNVAMIYQDPKAHINPVHTVGDFLTEGLVRGGGENRARAESHVVDLLADVGIADGRRRLRQYPHQLSGGLLQRVMIAAALAPGPNLLLADEPTTALDVTTQEEVVAILDELRRDRGLAMMFITHDLDLALAICDRIYVMYAGVVVEAGSADELHRTPLHPYTAGLMNSRPALGKRKRLTVIPGRPASAFEVEGGCVFRARCAFAVERCRAERPPRRRIGHRDVACHRAEELAEEHQLVPGAVG